MGRGDRKTVRWAKDRERKKKARAVQNFSERRRLYAQAHKLLLEEVPFIVLLDEPYIDAYRKSVKGALVLDPHMDIFWGVWLAK